MTYLIYSDWLIEELRLIKGNLDPDELERVGGGGTWKPNISAGSVEAENNLPFELSSLDGVLSGDLESRGEDNLAFAFWFEFFDAGSVGELIIVFSLTLPCSKNPVFPHRLLCSGR